MKQMKWILFILLAIGMLVGCGKTAPAKDQKAASKEEVKTTEAEKSEEQPKDEEQTKQDEVKQEEAKNDQTSSAVDKSTSPSESKKQEGKATVSAESAPAPSPSPVPPPAPKPPAPKPPVPPPPVANTVTISITGDKGMGTILGKTEVEIKDGDTVFNVLAYITKKKHTQMEYAGWGNEVYVKGINNLYEKDLGGGSGWMYRVNGVFANKSAGDYKVKNGDVIEWLYTLNLGKDIGGGW
ncbi:DUF4430 domain-containing protein [Microbacteriaceae bacterium 4G12]